LCDRQEVLLRVERQFAVERRVDGDTHERVQNRVAVGLCFGDGAHAHHPACAGPILDHDRLAETFADFWPNHARQRVD
jgi:hypothetical protein